MVEKNERDRKKNPTRVCAFPPDSHHALVSVYYTYTSSCSRLSLFVSPVSTTASNIAILQSYPLTHSNLLPFSFPSTADSFQPSTTPSAAISGDSHLRRRPRRQRPPLRRPSSSSD